MVSFTTNISLSKPANSSYVGTWDVPVNSNSDIIDAVIGSNTTISPGSGVTTLSTTQYQSACITFNSTLTGNATIVFPVSQAKGYTIQHRAANSSLYTITLQTTAASGEVIACPPYVPFDIYSDGTNVRFRNLGIIGQEVPYGGSSVPIWVTACTVPPYLNCDGTTFSSATYPALATILGGTTLPDSRGRYRADLNQGQSRITSGSSTGGVDGNTLLASGGSQIVALSSQNMPLVPITDPGHTHAVANSLLAINAVGGGIFLVQSISSGGTTTSSNAALNAVTNITAGSSSNTNFSNLPPTYIGGITLIRSA